MRYSVHPSRAFRNRIAKSIGVLVAAALIATLGLPSVAQAQSPAPPMVMHDFDTGDFMATIPGMPSDAPGSAATQWQVEYSQDGGTAKTMVGPDPFTIEADRSSDHGVWKFTASYMDSADPPKRVGQKSVASTYTLGRPAAPENFIATSTPGGYFLTFTSAMSDLGIKRYQYRTAADENWAVATVGQLVKDLKAGETYMFELRAIGSSSNSAADRANTDADNDLVEDDVPGWAATYEVMVPIGVPTLPEIAALFLAMLLLGSGAYLIRGRQSGGLTNA